jgi:hypothetical protein
MTLFAKPEPLLARTVKMAEIRMIPSPDQMEASLLFDTLIVRIDRNNLAADAAITMLKIPIAPQCATAIGGYLVHVRGSATLQARTRGWLFIAVGNAVATRTWPFRNAQGTASETHFDDFSLSIFAEDEIAAKDTNPNRPDPLPLPIAVMIEIEAESGAGVIQVDGIDIRVLA